MIRHARLLYTHLRELEQLNKKFDEISPVMEKLSKRKGKEILKKIGLMYSDSWVLRRR